MLQREGATAAELPRSPGTYLLRLIAPYDIPASPHLRTGCGADDADADLTTPQVPTDTSAPWNFIAE